VERFLRLLGPVPVLAHEVATACTDLAVLVASEALAILVANAERHADRRAAGGLEDRAAAAMIGGRQEGEDR
jgi:hypothetical protein